MSGFHNEPTNNLEPQTDTTVGRADQPAATEPLGDVPPNARDSAAAPSIEPSAAYETSAAVTAANTRLPSEPVTVPARAPSQASARRVRRTFVSVLVVLSCLGMLLSSVTIWTHQAFLDTDNWIRLVGPLGQDPKVVNAVSAYVANEVVAVLNVQLRAKQVLPPRAQFLVAPLTKDVHDFTQTKIADLMHTQAFENVWIATNRHVHSEVLATLRGQTKNVIISHGAVTLNLVPIISQALQTLKQDLSGLIPANAQLPDVSQIQAPSQARAKLSQALGVQLPADFGEITLFQSDQLAKAQLFLRVFELLTVLLPLITVLLLATAVWLSLNRRRTLIELGIGTAITFLIARIVVGYLEGRVINGIKNPTAQGIAGGMISTAVSGLLTLTVLLLIAGAVTAIVAYLFGKPEWFAAAYAQGKASYARARDGMIKR